MRIQRLRQIETCLHVIRVGIHRRLKLCHGARIGCLSCQLKLRMRGLKLGRFRDFDGCAVQMRFGLIKLIQRDIGAHHPAISTGMVRVFAQDRGKSVQRVLRRPFGQHVIRGGNGL